MSICFNVIARINNIRELTLGYSNVTVMYCHMHVLHLAIIIDFNFHLLIYTNLTKWCSLFLHHVPKALFPLVISSLYGIKAS